MAIAHIFRKADDSNMLYAWFSAMHTRVDIMLVGDADEAELVMVAERLKRRIAEIEAVGNCFNAESELARFNSHRLAREELSQELLSILEQCGMWKAETGGLFDVAVEGRVNLSGFLKGYALDQLKPLLVEHGIHSALLNMGNSSVMALGCGPGSDDDGWLVRTTDGKEYRLHDECLTTSGNDSAERRHIINPLTGEYVVGKRQVSVVTQGGAQGEVMATVEFIARRKME